LDVYEIKVRSELYGETVCVVEIAAFQTGRRIFCCGDGCDYRLSKSDVEGIADKIKQDGLHAYEDMRNRHAKEFGEFPIFFAFDGEQFAEGMRKLGLAPEDTGQVCSFARTGGFYRRGDHGHIQEMLERQEIERQDAISGDLTGDGYIYGMFCFQLKNHEYTYTYDPEDTLNTLNLSWDEVNGTPKLLHGLNEAMAALRKVDAF
jgi:hypothetical protein